MVPLTSCLLTQIRPPKYTVAVEPLQSLMNLSSMLRLGRPFIQRSKLFRGDFLIIDRLSRNVLERFINDLWMYLPTTVHCGGLICGNN